MTSEAQSDWLVELSHMQSHVGLFCWTNLIELTSASALRTSLPPSRVFLPSRNSTASLISVEAPEGQGITKRGSLCTPWAPVNNTC
jgi:hypothetical protein